MGITNVILLVTGLISQVVLWVALLRGRVHWQFPFFFFYTTYSILGTATLLATTSHYRVYYYAFWANEAGLAGLGLLALQDVFQKVFFGFYKQFFWFRLLFPSMVVLTLLLVLWSAHQRPSIPGSTLRSIILLGGSAVNFVQVGIFCLFIATARTFRLRWHFAPLGILLGFTLAALGSVVDYWAVSFFGTKVENYTKYLPPVAYILAIAIWLDAFFFRPEPGPGNLSAATLRQLAGEIRQDAMILKKITEKLK